MLLPFVALPAGAEPTDGYPLDPNVASTLAPAPYLRPYDATVTWPQIEHREYRHGSREFVRTTSAGAAVPSVSLVAGAG